MGRVISSVIKDRDDCTVISGVDLNTERYADFEIYENVKNLPEKPDVIIDYTHPSCLLQYGLLDYCLSTGTAIVIATTGYNEEQIEAIKKGGGADTGVLYFQYVAGYQPFVQACPNCGRGTGRSV